MHSLLLTASTQPGGAVRKARKGGEEGKHLHPGVEVLRGQEHDPRPNLGEPDSENLNNIENTIDKS